MFVTVEISYYPLTGEFENPIDKFIILLSENREIRVEPGQMSSLISGEYIAVMKAITIAMDEMMKTFPSVFTFKVSNICRKISS